MLRKQFPNIQFIVATHSPLIAIGAGENALTLKLSSKDGNVSCEPVAGMALMDVDRALQSEALGLETTFSLEAQERINEYEALVRKRKSLNEDEKKQYEELIPFISETVGYRPPPEPGSLEEKIDNFLRANLK